MRIPGRKVLLRAGLGLLLAAVVLQLLPFGRLGANPPVTRDAPWPNGRVRELAVAACYDCHSHQTVPQRQPPELADGWPRTVLGPLDPSPLPVAAIGLAPLVGLPGRRPGGSGPAPAQDRGWPGR
jgi:hypothetical protein